MARQRLNGIFSRFGFPSTIASLAILGLSVGCDQIEQAKLMQQGQEAIEQGVEQGQVAVEEGAAAAGEELERELSASGIDYPATPQEVFVAARQASVEGKWPLYLTYLSGSSVEKMARNFIQAASTGRPPQGVNAGPDFADRVEIIKAVLTENGVDPEELDAANDDTAAHTKILGYFASPAFFVAEVMKRVAPGGVAELPPIESVQWSTQGDAAAATFSGPNGEPGIIAFKKVDELWKIDT